MPEGSRRASFLGYAANVSETGLFVQCSKPRPKGTRLSLRLHLPTEPGALVFRSAEVVWTSPFRGRRGPPAGMGIQLLEMAVDAYTAWSRFCSDLASRPCP